MLVASTIAETWLDSALRACNDTDTGPSETLEKFPVPVYLTDVQGKITFFNDACVVFAGRIPQVGSDNWCVTWKLYTPSGEFLPHEECPMAIAIREKRAVRGVEAIAERPDGSRVPFLPYPTPLFDAEGGLIGALNMFIDLSDERKVLHFRDQANRCRRLARSVDDKAACLALTKLAVEFDLQAAEIEAG